LFISKGNVIVYDGDENQIHRLGSDSPLLPPVVGDIAFFVGCPQPFSAKVAPRGDAQLLVLSRESYLNMKGAFPEQHEVILRNICSKFGLNVKVRLTLALATLSPNFDPESKYVWYTRGPAVRARRMWGIGWQWVEHLWPHSRTQGLPGGPLTTR
jgi:hypothetical protein